MFIDGCFWHGCPEHGTWPKNNAAWWAEKLAGMFSVTATLISGSLMAGWHVVRVWEHEPAAQAASGIADLIGDKTANEQR